MLRLIADNLSRPPFSVTTPHPDPRRDCGFLIVSDAEISGYLANFFTL